MDTSTETNNSAPARGETVTVTSPTAENHCKCNRGDCDACRALNPLDTPPWGWSAWSFESFVEREIIKSLNPRGQANRLNTEPGKATDEAVAWCVFVVLITTAAMAHLSESEVSRG